MEIEINIFDNKQTLHLLPVLVYIHWNIIDGVKREIFYSKL